MHISEDQHGKKKYTLLLAWGSFYWENNLFLKSEDNKLFMLYDHALWKDHHYSDLCVYTDTDRPVH